VAAQYHLRTWRIPGGPGVSSENPIAWKTLDSLEDHSLDLFMHHVLFDPMDPMMVRNMILNRGVSATRIPGGPGVSSENPIAWKTLII
jgi:hypothetical protein